MKNFKKLSRNDLKEINGGKACTLSIQAPNGTWINYPGTCNYTITMVPITDELSVPVKHSFCNAGLGDVPLSSNGGVSRC
ncbi:bacteriocin-like protein [Chryseobacterium sp. VD8]|uniref:bacteriocin-like protein n=1 Tax=Chryseobacterium sp. VD8 TaxID=3081254 RepID=UPI003018D62E